MNKINRSANEINSGLILANYVIFRYQNKIYATNGDTGQIDFAGNNASSIIQGTMDVLSDNEKIFIKDGTYVINSTVIYQKDKIAIEGEGQGTILKLVDNANVDILSSGRRNNIGITIRNLSIDGNKENNISGRGLVFTGYYSTIDNIYIKNCAGNGFDAEVPIGSTESMVDNFISNIRTSDCNGTGFIWGTQTGGAGSDNYLQNIVSWYNGNDGIDLKSGAIYGWNINSYGNKGDGIIIRGGATRITIAESSDNDRHGFRLYRAGGWRTVIVGGRSWNNSKSEAGKYDGFIIDGDGIYTECDTNLIGCAAWNGQIHKTQNWGVNASYQTSTSRNIVIGGSFSGNIQTKGINVSGNVLRARYINNLFDNSGSVVIAPGTDSINVIHELVSAPDIKKIMVTPRDNLGGRNFWVESHPSDPDKYFIIKISNGDTLYHIFNWRAEI